MVALSVSYRMERLPQFEHKHVSTNLDLDKLSMYAVEHESKRDLERDPLGAHRSDRLKSPAKGERQANTNDRAVRFSFLVQGNQKSKRLTISKRTSPAEKASPSFFFHEAIPPSVMVGDMAGKVYLARASRGAEVDRSVGGGPARTSAMKRREASKEKSELWSVLRCGMGLERALVW